MSFQKTIKRLGVASALAIAAGGHSFAQTPAELPSPDPDVAFFDAAIRNFQKFYIAKDRVEKLQATIAVERQRVMAREVDPVKAVNTVLKGADPHSYFLQTKIEAGEKRVFGFQALGLKPALQSGQVSIAKVYFNSSAADHSVLEGDVVTAINGQPVNALSVDKTICTGDDNVVKVNLRTPESGESSEVDLKCEYDFPHTASGRMIGDDIVYIAVEQFTPFSSFDVQRTIEDIEPSDEVKGYILDLRDNPGGYAHEARDMLDMFVDSKEPLFVELDSSGKSFEPQLATPGDILKGKPLVVLINHNSWSASELVAMSLQFHNRAKIVGEITGGKGSVQTYIPVYSGGVHGRSGELGLTTSFYAMPDGNSPQLKGVAPDVVVPTPANITGERGYENVLDNPKGNQFTDSERARMQACPPNGDDDVILKCGVDTLRTMIKPVPAPVSQAAKPQAMAALPAPR